MLIRWPATKPSETKFCSALPAASVTVVPEIVTLPLKSWVGTRPPTAASVRPGPVAKVWPSVMIATCTFAVGWLVSLSV